MRLPAIRGIIDRRILVNFRIDPDILAAVLPSPFRPQLVNGYGIAGICLIRLKAARPRWLPAFMGFSSENAAHRAAVEWNERGRLRTGVFVPRRDTSSRLMSLAGGRVFPGLQHHAKFEVRETDSEFLVSMSSIHDATHVSVKAGTTHKLPDSSAFQSIQHVSEFFRTGSIGYSPGHGCAFDGLELACEQWIVEPLAVTEVESSWFDNESIFPRGSVQFDNALLMRGIDHEWHSRSSIRMSAIAAETA